GASARQFAATSESVAPMKQAALTEMRGCISSTLFETIILRPEMTIEELLGIDGDVVRLPDGWGNQWGTTYGGYMAAILLHAFERRRPPGHPPSGAPAALRRAPPARPAARAAVP